MATPKRLVPGGTSAALLSPPLYYPVRVRGTQAAETLLKREDIPKPNYLVNSS